MCGYDIATSAYLDTWMYKFTMNPVQYFEHTNTRGVVAQASNYTRAREIIFSSFHSVTCFHSMSSSLCWYTIVWPLFVFVTKICTRFYWIHFLHMYLWTILLWFCAVATAQRNIQSASISVAVCVGSFVLCTCLTWCNNYEITLLLSCDAIRFLRFIQSNSNYETCIDPVRFDRCFQRSTQYTCMYYIYLKEYKTHSYMIVYRPISVSCSTITLIYLYGYVAGIKPIGASFLCLKSTLKKCALSYACACILDLS